MAEYIERESAYEDFEKCNSENPKWTPSRVKTLIARQEAVDAVPVVRCRECKFGSWDSEPDDAMVCVRTNDGFWRSGNDFCSYGKRKEGADRMDVRKKLVEILKQAPFEGKVLDEWWWEEKINRIADHLIRNGVTVQELDACKYCEEHEDLPEHFVSGKPVGRVFDTCIQTDENGRWHLEVPSGADIGIKFCPMCGRKLPQPPKGE